MERLRRELIQKMPAWGDPSPGDSSTKSGQIQLSHNILQHCQATYRAYLEKLDAVKSMPPRRPVEPTNREPVSIQEWTFDSLISHSSNFKRIRRVSALSDAAIISRELKTFESEGVPLIIEDWHKHTRWPKEEFNLEWFKSNCSPNIPVRNLIDGSDKDMFISDFIDKCHSAPCTAGQERLYGKDVECPGRWEELLDQIGLPSCILPGNSTDLLSNQPDKVRVKTLMCYLGAGGTFTPCHKDSCASSGQNLMCYTESGGSAFWFMTATSDIFLATQYFHSIKQELDHERHLIAIDKLAEAPFPIYITEQKLGDLVLVPSRSCHQVINKGGITIKTSWSRMTLEGLIAANYHELPVYQRVCRGEVYRVKSTVYSTIKILVESLNAGGKEQIKRRANSRPVGPGTRQRKILRRLLSLYVDILNDERPPPGFTDLRYICDSPKPSSCNIDNPQDLEEDLIVCDFCGADIFQSFFECNHCFVENGTAESGGGCVICPRCYVDGRTCKCGNMVAMQCRQFQILEDVRIAAVEVLGKPCKNQNDPDTLAKNKHNGLGIFAAACFKYQSSLPDTIGISRDTQKHDGMYCSGCRRTCSFQQLFAKYETHAVDVLLGSQDQQLYHKRVHGKDRKVYGEHDIIAFAESVKAGTRPNLQFQRYHNVAYFTTCLPASQIVRPGYYDEVWDTMGRSHRLTFHANQTIVRKRRKPSLQHLSTSLTTWHQEAMSPLSALSALDDLSSDEQVLAHASANTQTKRRKRLVIDCIEIPLRRSLAKERNVEGRCSLRSERHGLEIKAELVEDTMQEQTGSNAKCGMAVERCDHNQIPRELTRLRDTNDDQVTCTNEGRNASKQSLKRGNIKKRKIEHCATKSDASKSDRRKVNSTQITGKRKGVKRKMSSSIRAGDGVDKSTPVNQPQRRVPVLARGSTEHPLSGDDSETVVARTPQLHESIEQPRALQSTLSEHSLIPIHRELSFNSGTEVSPVGRAAESAKRPLDTVDRQSATNAGEDGAPAPKRRRLARNSQHTYSDSTRDVCPSSELDCGASQLANTLSSALTANDSISGSVNSTERRSHDTGESDRRSVVHDHERPKPADPQQTFLSVDETERFKQKINWLTDRVAALEKSLEDKMNPAVNFFVPSSPPHPLYCLPIPFGQIEGRRFPAQNAVLTHRASSQFFRHQYSQYHQYPQYSQYPQYPAGPSKSPQSIYGQSNKQPPISPRLWRNRGEQRPPGGNLNREKHQDNSHRAHGTVGVPEASSSRRPSRWSSPVAGPSNTNRYPARTVVEREKIRQRLSRTPLPSPSRHGKQGAPDGDGKRCDNDKQHAQEQDVTGPSLSHRCDSPSISNDAAYNENQHAQQQDATGLSHPPLMSKDAANENQHVQQQIATGDPPPIGDDTTTNENQRAQERVATRWDSPSSNVAATNGNQRAQEQVGTRERLSHGSSNDAVTNEKQRAQEQVGIGERLSHGWSSLMVNNGATNEEQESQWEDDYVQDDDGHGVGTKVAPGEGSHKSWAKDADSGKAAAVLDAPWMNNPWNS